MSIPTTGASAPAVFSFDSTAVRTFADDHGEPWFCAADVCSILGYRNSRQAVQKNCREGGVSTRDTPTTSGIQPMTFINEGNLYRLIVKSRKPEAERFEQWLMEEVLPAIRKTGSYGTQPELKFAMPEEEAMNMAMDYVARLLDAVEPAKRPRLDGDKILELSRTIVSRWMLSSDRWMVTFNFQGRIQLTQVPYDAFMVSEKDLPKMIASPDAISTSSMVPIIMAAAERIGRRLQ